MKSLLTHLYVKFMVDFSIHITGRFVHMDMKSLPVDFIYIYYNFSLNLIFFIPFNDLDLKF